jgi:DNA-binding MarR family transcriptional regulator
LAKERQKDRVSVRDLVCFWCVSELSIPQSDLAKRFDITPSAVGCAVAKGEKLAAELGYSIET